MTRSSEDYSLYYSNWYRNEDTYYQSQVGPLRRGRLKRAFELRQDATVLEVGCGPGVALNALIEGGFSNVVGIDTSAQQVALAKGRGLPAVLVESTTAWLESSGQRYDAVLAFDVLEHMPKAELIGVLAALQQALLPGGVLVGTVPNANHAFSGRMMHSDFTHELAFTEHSLAYVLRNAGFSVLEILEEDQVMETVARFTMRDLLRRCFRTLRRLEAWAEFGKREGSAIPLSRNLYFTATRT